MSHEAIPIFIGFDKREAIAYHVCQQSILDHCSEPNRLEFHPVTGEMRDGSNAFTYARFEVPYRRRWSGHAIFMDGDMVVRDDITKLWELRRADLGVQVVKHDYKTQYPTKYLGSPNADYPRKNWSSVVLWNCAFFPNRILTPDYVRRAFGSFLHRFNWLDDDRIGELPEEWNRLVLEQHIHEDDKLLHYTIGTPCFSEYADCDGAEHWHKSLANALVPIER